MKTVLFAGIGRLGIPAAEELACRGWNVAISYRTGRPSEKTVADIIRKNPENVLGVPAEISRKQEAEMFIRTAWETYGRVDALINIASWYPPEADWQRWQKGEGVSDDDWKYYDSNVIPIRNATLAVLALDQTLDDVCIINFVDTRSLLYVEADISDPYAEIGGIVNATQDAIKTCGLEQLARLAPPRQVNPYTLSKRDITYLTRTLALDMEGKNIRVNAIAPGPMLPPPDKTEEETRPIVEQTLLKRWGHEQPITHAINYLLQANFTTGQTLTPDGGFYLYQKFKKGK
ncbi:MAG: SDR family oxidoreductase [Sedimentisphaerales bacterium]|nr:SDR family oxidoreductase [Sedimentisphaerales bacterium]